MHTTIPKYLFGIIGNPLGHTASPYLHTWAFGQISLPASYYAWPLKEDELKNFITTMHLLPIHGASVTVPYKQAIIPFLDDLDKSATDAGAVNTLYWLDGKLRGANTDIWGFIYPLQTQIKKYNNALVLGAGGASRAVLAGLRLLSTDLKIYVAARSLIKAQELGSLFEATPLPWSEKNSIKADLVINTTPLGLSGTEQKDESPLSESDFINLSTPGKPCLAYDLVYKPLETPFLKLAKRTGYQTQDGLDMLIAQGLRQLEIWTGQGNMPELSLAKKHLLQSGLLTPSTKP